ncbi:RagB/SusD family nutrient uptake outer membrane protein [Mucilaginibacter daejeonensis]|uniref:RagB/SusD family nutrient uptake outer membrane protein n=1 Tax=Mucilaginibacter daejeonensis TaxID=398049 RepID=UPI001D17A763|nr:RagB/SusD family nutrient uptake outer membrane protein [Mucilaginibacter daejeonensis]UEG51482.1 RagB/SusD family nutrient uptake outer membrane protein [Mucilaginibacter daejeonensis]
MKNLNKNIVAGIAIAAVFVAAGCTKRSELVPEAPSKFTPDVTLTSPVAFANALNALNASVRFEFFGDSAPLLTESLFTDAAVEGTTDKTTPAQNLNASITPTANLDSDDFNKIARYWYAWYNGIKDANVIISRIDNATWPTPAARNQTLATAYFHRAYRYYRLVHEFGDVPLVLKEEKQINNGYFSTQRIVILRKMKEDLDFAVANLNDSNPKGTVSKGAAAHLLAKVDLALGLFDEAIAACNVAINGPYKLMTGRFGVNGADATKNVIWDLHRPENKAAGANTEALYVVLDRENLEGATPNGSQVMRNCCPMWHNGTILTPGLRKPGMSDAITAETPLTLLYGRGIGRLRGTPYATKYIWTDNTDLRHAPGNWINMTDLVYNNPGLKSGTNADPNWYGKKLEQYTADNVASRFVNGPRDTIRAWFSWPHYKVFIGSSQFASDKNWSPPRGTNTDWYVFRLAETYLLRAEAYVWKGQTSLAMADLNQVRVRAQAQLLTDAGSVNIGTILDERQRELYWEEPRKTELTRMAYIFAQTGIPAYNGKTYNIATFSTNNFMYDRVMEKNDFYKNPNVVTNSGNRYTISPYHVLWPIPQREIDLNITGRINQNKGYAGAELNVAPLDKIVQ